MGVNNNNDFPLTNCIADANAMEFQLNSIGFDVTKLSDPSDIDLARASIEFASSRTPNDVGLLFCWPWMRGISFFFAHVLLFFIH